MVEVQTVFLTPGWEDWAAEFRRQAKTFDQVVPASEHCWVSVGERQNVDNLVATIQRQKATSIRTGWKMARGTEPNTYRYERIWETGDPSVEEIVEEIRNLLSAPESAGA